MSPTLEVPDVEYRVRGTFLEFRPAGSGSEKMLRSRSAGSIGLSQASPRPKASVEIGAGASKVTCRKRARSSADMHFVSLQEASQLARGYLADSSASTVEGKSFMSTAETNSGCVSPFGAKETRLRSAIEALYWTTCQGKQPGRGEVSDVLLHLSTLAPMPSAIKSRLMSHLLWSLGKMQHKGIKACALHDLLPCSELMTFHLSDLCAMLWGSVKLGLVELAGRIITALDSKPLEEVPPPSVANAMWCLSTLKLNTAAATSVFRKLLQLAVGAMRSFTCQGVANSLWAVAVAQDFRSAAGHFLQRAVARAMELQASLFQHEELCMAVWALGKIIGRNASDFLRGEGKCVQDWLLLAFSEATERIGRLKVQGVSMIATTLKHLKQEGFQEARSFLSAAARELSGKVHQCSGQALANLCHAFVSAIQKWPETLEKPGTYKEKVVRFAKAVAKRMGARPWDYAWRDLAAVASSFARAKLHVPEVRDFAEALLKHAEEKASLAYQDSVNLASLMNLPPKMEPRVGENPANNDRRRNRRKCKFQAP
ncbi:unnamed protein product [Effrenium voratum]|nr:unnamed protein product [Effrenium voratum]